MYTEKQEQAAQIAADNLGLSKSQVLQYCARQTPYPGISPIVVDDFNRQNNLTIAELANEFELQAIDLIAEDSESTGRLDWPRR